MRRLRIGLFILFAWSLGLFAGCQKKAAPAAAATAPASTPNGGGLPPPGVGAGVAKMLPTVGRAYAGNDLKQIAMYYKMYGDGTRSPSKLEDLPDLKRDLPKVYQGIQDGVYVVYWGAPPASSGSAILAHVRDAPTTGGMVVRFDGSLDNMTPEQFKEAPKVGQ